METDIIADGFRTILSSYGVIHKTVIGDSESSVYKKPGKIHPYSHLKIGIKKIECKNHLFRNFGKKIVTAGSITIIQQVKQQLPIGTIVDLRNRVKRSGNFLRKLICETIERINNNDISFEEKVERFINGIEPIINHTFGDHTKCNREYKFYEMRFETTC